MSPRQPREVEVYVWRRASHGVEVLLLRRSERLGGFWHCVAGAVDVGESEPEAAGRELREETGLTIAVVDSGVRYAYPVDEDRRHEFAGGEEISVTCFTAEAPLDADVELDWEHDEIAWRALSEAASVLHYDAVAGAMLRALTPRALAR